MNNEPIDFLKYRQRPDVKKRLLQRRRERNCQEIENWEMMREKLLDAIFSAPEGGGYWEESGK
ncbi:hypothetical protein [Acidihalobacter ferrooxydans]|uniref:Uncharacterized protein n=1 Tax=Acidihalobacter ferrooxydans TaxID=1765967 RepID=A0A1P8UF86_9GAMM|nr:hypothetical protein [Acidihalobacter ferrooxydans]APZ42510.1 hypothetical protein BW247_04905 [Acidihalobacter ferrooxydans]